MGNPARGGDIRRVSMDPREITAFQVRGLVAQLIVRLSRAWAVNDNCVF